MVGLLILCYAETIKLQKRCRSECAYLW